MPTKPGKPCATPGCDQVVAKGTRCQECSAKAEQARGSRHERGYGNQHYRDGDRAIAGATHCLTCGQPFTADNPVTRGHRKDIRAGGTTDDGYLPQCRRCNYGWRASP